MKKVLLISVIILILLSFSVVSNAIITNSSEYSNVKVYIFYEEENDEYQQEKNWLDENVNINKEYINTNENEELLAKIKDTLRIKKDDLPITVVGSAYFIGFDEKVQNNIKEAIEAYKNAEEYGNIVEKIRNNQEVKEIIKQNKKIYQQPGQSHITLNIIFIIIVICIVILILKFLKKKKPQKNFKINKEK